ncbi:hypothetical protein NliqN6_5862 [Naganishia liquefaciens]|uniref:Uncharacterized protein n=1 Tax=Naganishia liquefaciens TaxID=104408 RepID=A0A8H3TYZ9_9TREE|nr:hypothetical protein NliqN6_5862 [Naganishia liquefaciens]
MSSPSQYQAANIAPLIKSPSLWLPKPVELPMDIHPLPDDISAYFVYPFTLEPHILAQDPPIHEKIRMQRDRYASLLVIKAQESEARRKEQLNRIAPGYNPSTTLLVPSQRATTTQPTDQPEAPGVHQQREGKEAEGPEDAFLSLKIV